MARSNGLLPVRKWSNQTFAFLASDLPLFCKRSLCMNHDLHLDSICTLYRLSLQLISCTQPPFRLKQLSVIAHKRRNETIES